jgi:hypothetical protein
VTFQIRISYCDLLSCELGTELVNTRRQAAKAAHEISVYEVIQAVDPIEHIRDCPLGLDDMAALIKEQFRATTIAELLIRPGGKGFHFPKALNQVS